MLRKILTYEPVMSLAFATSLLAAVANVLHEFDVYDITEGQQAAVLALLTVLAPLVSFVVRQQVTPTAKL